MSDNEPTGDKRFDYIKERIAAAFPRLNGPKFDKQISTDEIRYHRYHFYIDVFFNIVMSIHKYGNLISRF